MFRHTAKHLDIISNSGYCRDLQKSTPFLDLQCRYRRRKNPRVALVPQIGTSNSVGIDPKKFDSF